jgi:murein DD-endopeptidase MepM/ murein hydrolase activator NlpD
MTTSFQTPPMALLQSAHASLVRQPAASRPGASQPATTTPPAFSLAPAAQTTPESSMPAAYRVRQGDTLSHIARQQLKAAGAEPSNAEVYAAVNKIAEANGLRNPDLLQPGQQLDLRILEPKQAAPVVARAASPRAMAAPARSEARLERVLPPQDLLRELRGSRQALERARESSPAEAQGGPDTGAALSESSTRIESLLTRLRESMQALSDEPWAPVLGGEGRLTSGYGMRRDPFTGRQRFHHGIDLAAPVGTPILAPKGGTVVFSGWRPGYGNLVEIRHEDGALSRYGHNSANTVRRGERVDAGSMIAKVGSTGRSTGPHVHFEVRRDGRSVNPMPFLEASRVQLAAAHSR